MEYHTGNVIYKRLVLPFKSSTSSAVNPTQPGFNGEVNGAAGSIIGAGKKFLHICKKHGTSQMGLTIAQKEKQHLVDGHVAYQL